MYFLVDSRNTIASYSQITLDPVTHELMSTLTLGDMPLCSLQGNFLLLLSTLVHIVLLPSTHASSLPQFSTSGSCYYKHLFSLILRTSQVDLHKEIVTFKTKDDQLHRDIELDLKQGLITLLPSSSDTQVLHFPHGRHIQAVLQNT